MEDSSDVMPSGGAQEKCVASKYRVLGLLFSERNNFFSQVCKDDFSKYVRLIAVPSRFASFAFRDGQRKGLALVKQLSVERNS